MSINIPNKYFKFLFLTIFFIYIFLTIYFKITIGIGRGDESLFIKDIDFVKNNGWIEAIKHQISIPHMLLVYPLSLIFENYIALRLSSLLLTVAFVIYAFNRFRNKHFLVYLIFYITTVGSLFTGTNDALILLSLSVFFIEVFMYLTFQKVNFSLLFVSLVIGFYTRQMFVIYIPAILIGLYFMQKEISLFNKKIIIPIILFILLFVLNIPSIQQNGKLSYDNKAPNSLASWTQRQYLSQLKVNEGKLKNNTHVSWEETEKYLELNGKNSLPYSTSESVLFNIPMTIKEFFKDFYFVLKSSLRQSGIIVLFVLFSLFISIYKNKTITKKDFVPIISLIMISIFSLIIISYVETRWLVPIGIITIFYYSNYERINNDIPKPNLHLNKLFNLNYFILFFMMLYGVYRLFSKYNLSII